MAAGAVGGYYLASTAEKGIMGNAKNQALFNLQSRIQTLSMINQAGKSPYGNRTNAQEVALAKKAVQQITVNVNGLAKPADVARAIQKILQDNSLTGFPIQTVGKTTP